MQLLEVEQLQTVAACYRKDRDQGPKVGRDAAMEDLASKEAALAAIEQAMGYSAGRRDHFEMS